MQTQEKTKDDKVDASKKEDINKDEEKKEDEIVILKEGDYMIHILIEKAKNIKLCEFKDDETINGLFQIESFGKKEYSHQKDNIEINKDNKEVVWNEHLFIKGKNLSHEEIEKNIIQIKLINKSYERNAIVGQFDFDLAQIYRMNDEHALHNQWIAMNNPQSDKPNEIRVYTRLSISIQGPDDKLIKLEESLNEDEDIVALIPSSIKTKFMQVQIGILEAHSLPAMDSTIISKYDLNAYMSMSWQNCEQKTEIVNREAGKKEVVFNEMMSFGLQLPTPQDKLLIKVWDKNTIKAHEEIG